MGHSTSSFYERVARSMLTQVCRCGTIIRAARHKFDTAAHEHFTKECSVIKKHGGQAVRPVWKDWQPIPVYPPSVPPLKVRVMQQRQQLRFFVPCVAPSWARSPSSTPVLEPALIVLYDELTDPVFNAWETVTCNAIVRMLEQPNIQPAVQTMLGLMEQPAQTTARDEELVNLLHRVTLGLYG